jgi:anti-anti-sigma factor
VTVLPARDGACNVVRLSGEADVTTTELRDALAAEAARGPRLLLVEMTALTFIDSGATQMIIGAHHVMARDGATLALVRPGPAVSRVLDLLGVTRLIPVYASVSEAIASAR